MKDRKQRREGPHHHHPCTTEEGPGAGRHPGWQGIQEKSLCSVSNPILWASSATFILRYLIHQDMNVLLGYSIISDTCKRSLTLRLAVGLSSSRTSLGTTNKEDGAGCSGRAGAWPAPQAPTQNTNAPWTLSTVRQPPSVCAPPASLQGQAHFCGAHRPTSVPGKCLNALSVC